MISSKVYEAIVNDLFVELKQINEEYNYDEEIIQGTIESFLIEAENRYKLSRKKNKSASDTAWKELYQEYEISKLMYSKKLKPFIDDDFKRHSILRDVGNAYSLVSLGFYKEAVVISGGIIEEILRLFLISKKLISRTLTFSDYIKICEQNNLFKKGINKLSDFLRESRNFVHLSKELVKKDTINKANAKSALSIIFSFYYEL